MKWMFFAMQKTDFHVFEQFLAEKVSVKSLIATKSRSRSFWYTNSVFKWATKQMMRMARPQMGQKLLSQREKVA